MTNICELINVRKSYGRHLVIDNFNLAIQKGEMIAITGKSGSGKSTILNMLGLLEKPDRGTVQVCNEINPPVGSRKANRLRRNFISYLFQNFALIDPATVDDNLEIPLIYSRQNRAAKQAMKQAALERVGLNISLKQKIHELSGGEQQRVAIARILLKPCELILADEPTGSLDADNRNEILAILKGLHQEGKTIVIVTHDDVVAKACSRIIRLDAS